MGLPHPTKTSCHPYIGAIGFAKNHGSSYLFEHSFLILHVDAHLHIDLFGFYEGDY